MLLVGVDLADGDTAMVGALAVEAVVAVAVARGADAGVAEVAVAVAVAVDAEAAVAAAMAVAAVAVRLVADQPCISNTSEVQPYFFSN